MPEVSHYYMPGGPGENPDLSYAGRLTTIRLGENPFHAKLDFSPLLDAEHINPEALGSMAVLVVTKRYLADFERIYGQAVGTMTDKLGGFTEELTYVQKRDGQSTAYNPVMFFNGGLSPRKANEVLLHEFGHFVHYLSGEDKHDPYEYQNPVKRRLVQKLGYAGLAAGGGTLLSDIAMTTADVMPNTWGGLMAGAGGMLALGGIFSALQPRDALYMLSRNERYARRFARKYRDIQVIVSRD